MKWNPAQARAIEERDKNILVSAAAGSGKTAVLVERIRQLIVEEEVSVDRFLVVTFTNAAASEMKEKIVRSLTAEAEKADDKKLSYIRRQLALVNSANISTFHGFALEILRRYFYLTDLEPGFSVCDEEQAQIMGMKAIDNVFERHFEEDDREFISFLSKYGSDRNDNKAKTMVTELHRMIMSIPDPFEWLDRATEALDMSPEEFADSPAAKMIEEDIRESLEGARAAVEKMIEFMNDAGTVHLADKFQEYIEQFPGDDAGPDEIEAFFEVKMPRMVTKKEEKETLAEIKDELNAIKARGMKDLDDVKKKYFSQSMEDMVSDIRDTYEDGVFLSRLVREYHDEYRRLKAEKNFIDFSDIEHYALDILAAEPKVAEEYRKKFRYIFIDEYQDSNDVQERLIEYIKRDNNLFMVGDVKQSIYKFRLAEPEIFMAKYKRYGSGEDKNSIRIDFNENYRSKRGVIDAVNSVFMGRMEGYDEANRLNKGIAYEGDYEYPAQAVICLKEAPEEMEPDDEVMNLHKAELEATVCAQLIKENLGKEIFDVKADKVRNMDYSDMVVLMRSTKSYSAAFQSVLETAGIPVYIDGGEGYFDTVEIEMIQNMLRIADNSRQDIPLISVLYSPVMNFTVDDLMDIRMINRNGEFFRAFEEYCRHGENQQLKDKCIQARDTVENWKLMARSMDVSDLVWSLIWDTGYYTYAGALPGGLQRQANLRALADRALKLSGQGINDLYGLLSYIDAMRERKIAAGQVKTCSEDDNVVRIMTVHKSKGLEFPLVIAAGAGNRFNTMQRSSSLSCHKAIGYSISLVDPDMRWHRKTILQHLIERRSRKESLEEEKRILYVEYTRAMDRLYILGTADSFDPDAYYGDKADNPLEYVLPSGIETRTVALDEIGDMRDVTERNTEDIKEILKGDCDVSEEVERRLTFSYSDSSLTEMKYKYSVTELAGYDEFRIDLASASFDSDRAGTSPAEAGTVTHKIMEHIDFAGPDIDVQVEDMVRRNILSSHDAEIANVDGVRMFLESDIGRRVIEAEKVWREQPFTMMTERDGVPVMVQGIIDCFFEEDGEIVLIDYKNTSVKSEEVLRERYEMQLDLYEKAIGEATGMKVKERYLYLLMEGRLLEM